MNLKFTAVAVAAMLTVVGGAAAVSGTSMSPTADADTAHDAAVAATYDNGTVTVSVTNDGEAVENATIEVGDEEYTTDANGTVVAENVNVDDELDIEVEDDGFEAEQEYTLEDDELTLVSEEYEYETADEDEREEDADEDEDERKEDADDEAEEEDDEKESEEDDGDDEETEADDDDEGDD